MHAHARGRAFVLTGTFFLGLVPAVQAQPRPDTALGALVNALEQDPRTKARLVLEGDSPREPARRALLPLARGADLMRLAVDAARFDLGEGSERLGRRWATFEAVEAPNGGGVWDIVILGAGTHDGAMTSVFAEAGSRLRVLTIELGREVTSAELTAGALTVEDVKRPTPGVLTEVATVNRAVAGADLAFGQSVASVGLTPRQPGPTVPYRILLSTGIAIYAHAVVIPELLTWASRSVSAFSKRTGFGSPPPAGKALRC